MSDEEKNKVAPSGDDAAQPAPKKVKETPSGGADADASVKVEVPTKFKELVDNISEMSVIDLSELVKVLEDKFGVSAAAPVVMGAMQNGAAGGDGAGEVEEKSVFNIELTEAGDSKIAVIKAVRAVTEKGLKEAKDMVDAAPQVVKEGVGKEEAEEIKKTLEEAGAKVTLK